MEVRQAERRISHRLQFRTALRFRVWKSGPAEQSTESLNLSQLVFSSPRMNLCPSDPLSSFFLTCPKKSPVNPRRTGAAPLTSCVLNRWIRSAASSVSAHSLTAMKLCAHGRKSRFDLAELSMHSKNHVASHSFTSACACTQTCCLHSPLPASPGERVLVKFRRMTCKNVPWSSTTNR